MRARRICPAIAALLLPLWLAAGAGAATITVTETTDDYFAPPGGECSLREAVQAANDNSDFGGCTREGTGSDRIILTGGTTYTRTRTGADDTNSSGDLDVTGETVFKVVGEGIATIDADNIDRVLEAHPGASLVAKRVSFANGATDPPALSTNAGGGILNHGRLELTNSSVFGNDVEENSGCACGGGLANYGRATLDKVFIGQNIAQINFGGGVAAVDGRLTLKRSTLALNRAGEGGGVGIAIGDGDRVRVDRTTITENLAQDTAAAGALEQGGGVYVASNPGSSQRFTNVTISGNDAVAEGAGVYLFSGVLRLNAATITANESGADGGGVFSNDGGVRLLNSILWGNLDDAAGNEDCVDVTSLGHNLFGTNTGCDDVPSDLTTADAKLRPLEDNGGPTTTHALRKASPAVGLAGQNAPERDQRGERRDADPDAGAYER